MKKEFDFDDIGKKTPYRVPEGFFDEMQRNVRKHTYGGKPAGHRLWITVSAGIAIAAALVGFLFMPSLFREGDRGGQMLIPGIVRRRPLLINGFVKCRTRSWKSSSASPKAVYF